MNNKGIKNGANADPKKTDKNIKPLKSIKNEVYELKPKQVKTKNPAKQRELGEQPVYPIKKAPKES